MYLRGNFDERLFGAETVFATCDNITRDTSHAPTLTRIRTVLTRTVTVLVLGIGY